VSSPDEAAAQKIRLVDLGEGPPVLAQEVRLAPLSQRLPGREQGAEELAVELGEPGDVDPLKPEGLEGVPLRHPRPAGFA
jgi:hypothetical protein